MKNISNPNQRFREWREASGLKRADIANAFKNSNKEIGSSYQAIKDIEDGNRTINVDHLEILMNSFNLNPIWILTGEGNKIKATNKVSEPAGIYQKKDVDGLLNDLAAKHPDSQYLINQLQKKINELTEERDELMRKLLGMHEEIMKIYKKI